MATSNSFTITAGVTSFACDFGATDKETIVLTISSTGAVISSNDYSVLGVAASATAGDITIEWDDAGDYVGETLIVSKYTNINTGAPADSMLVTFTSSGTTNPTNIQNEFAHLYDIVGQITGGTAVGTYDIADIGTVIARLNDLADDIFTTTTNSGTPAVWDGTNTLSIGGDTNVQSILTTHESRLDAAETLLGFDTGGGLTSDVVASILAMQANLSDLNDLAGIPNPYAPLLPSGTRLLFHQTAAPTGWTKDTTATYNGAMIVGTTGAVASGGSADATTYLASHVHPIAHTHSVPNLHTHTVSTPHTHSTSFNVMDTVDGISGVLVGVPYAVNSPIATGAASDSSFTTAGGSAAETSGGSSAANSTAPTTSPKYYSVIVASKD